MASSADTSSSQQQLFCCLINCSKEPSTKFIEENGMRVEVRAFEPKSKNKMVVNWQRRGEAQFHRQCWDALLQAAKGVNTASRIELTDLERSMILESKKTAEYHDSDATVKKEAAHIAQILKRSKYGIAFTGAGISTAAGIDDFRGKDGKWTNREKQKNYGAAAKSSSRGVILEQLRPTYTHEVLVKLMEMGILKYIISQNTDGLHMLSGVSGDNLSELHGNSFVERCEDCTARYERMSSCRMASDKVPPLKCTKCKFNHRTGRTCTREGCSSYLMNTIINFGDYLESDVLRSAEHQANQSDVVLVLGSTLRVSPANDLVVMGPEPHRLLICNRQTTPYDEECDKMGPDGKLGSRVFGDCDQLMREIMKQLLPLHELRAWEDGRATRMMEYSLKRSSV